MKILKKEKKMRKLIFATLLITIFAGGSGFAQETIIDDLNYATLEKYVQLAKDNFPRKKIFDNGVEQAKASVSMSTLSYLDIFNASYFYRPDDKQSINLENPYSVNGFQFSVNVNLGTFLQKPAMAKRARSELKVAELEAKEYDLAIAIEVKKRYYNYIRLLKNLKIKTQTTQDNRSVAENLRRRFEKGEIQLEQYNLSRVRASDADSEKIQAEMDFLVAKDALEEIIGQKLADSK